MPDDKIIDKTIKVPPPSTPRPMPSQVPRPTTPISAEYMVRVVDRVLAERADDATREAAQLQALKEMEAIGASSERERILKVIDYSRTFSDPDIWDEFVDIVNGKQDWRLEGNDEDATT